MASLDSPTIEGFKPVATERVFGIEHLKLLGPAGVHLELSEYGIAAAIEDPQLISLLERMADFIAENGGYRDTAGVRSAEPCRTLSAAEAGGKAYGLRRRVSSVYAPDFAPNVVIKAYDFDGHAAAPQYHFGGLLHSLLAEREGNLSSPRQLGLFTSSEQHKTVVMERVPGHNLLQLSRSLRCNYDADDIYSTLDGIHDHVAHDIRRLLSRTGRIITDDLVFRNIMLDDSEEVTLDKLHERPLSVIDIAEFGFLKRPVFKAMRAFAQAKNMLHAHTQPTMKRPLARTV